MKTINKQIHSFVKETKEREEIRIKELFFIFTKSKWIIVGLMVFFLILGVIRATTSPQEYITTSKVLTERSNQNLRGNLANLGALAGLTGRNINDEGFPAELYPAIVTNDDFLLSLASEKYFFEKENQDLTLVTYFAHYEKKNLLTIAFQYPRTLLISLFNTKKESNNPITIDTIPERPDSSAYYNEISGREQSAINKLLSRITVSKSENLIEISTKMPDPKVSAILNKKIISHLMDYVTEYKSDRERRNMEFVATQLTIAERKYRDAQTRLASFKDGNRGLILEIDRTTLQRLESDFSLSSQIYNNLAMQLEQSKIKLEESKPMLSVFKAPTLPLGPSEPNVTISAIVFGILGLFVGVLFITSKIILEFFKQA